jgi:CheY-like chemotaxis protein
MNQDHTILLVDDDAANLSRITQALQELEMGIETAGNGMEALEVLARLAGPHGFSGIIITGSSFLQDL